MTPASPYILWRGRVTSQLDLRDNRKVITDYRNHGITRILTDLVVSSGYLPGVLRGAPSSAVFRKASSCGLGHPWVRNPCSLPWVSGSYPHIDFCFKKSTSRAKTQLELSVNATSHLSQNSKIFNLFYRVPCAITPISSGAQLGGRAAVQVCFGLWLIGFLCIDFASWCHALP